MTTKWALDSVISAVVEAIAVKSDSDEGLRDVWTLVAEAPVAAGDLARPAVRRQITNWLLGGDRAQVEERLADELGVDAPTLAPLLESVLGVYLTHLRRRTALERFAPQNLRAAIADERSQTAVVRVDLTNTC